MERIDDYFNNRLGDTDRAAFEHELETSPELQEAVAWYLASREAAHRAALEARHHSWQALRSRPAPEKRRFSWWYPAAAAVLVGFFAWFFIFRSPASPTLQQQAAAYAGTHFSRIAVQMSGQTDSLQQGRNLYNQGNYSAALALFESILQTSPDDPEALESAGLAAYRLQRFRDAAGYFERQGALNGLYVNPGKFYQAIALSQQGDGKSTAKAEALLKEVVSQKLTGKETASAWLDKAASEQPR